MGRPKDVDIFAQCPSCGNEVLCSFGSFDLHFITVSGVSTECPGSCQPVDASGI